jgi:hypothetical protein
METTTTRAIYDLRDLMDEHLTTSNLVTRDTGRSIRESIELRLEREPEGTVVALDFTHVGIIDFSCADEVISKLVARLQGLEYGDKYIVLHALTPTHEENITVALERKKLAVLVSRPDGSWRLLGSLNPYLNEALQFVMNQRRHCPLEHHGGREESYQGRTRGTHYRSSHRSLRLPVRRRSHP